MSNLKSIFLIVFLVFTFGEVFSQTQIKGILKKSESEVLPYSSVTVRDLQNRIVAYSTSDVKGEFNMRIAERYTLDSLELHVNHLSYHAYKQKLYPLLNFYEITLQEKVLNLDEVIVRNRPVLNRSGDTLSYTVDQFAQIEDRSIEDVIKRMPGITVEENGQILFNGEPISHFYIDGDDLLGGRYSVGSKSIPYAMVQKLEVVQNHQPLKVLKNLVSSDKVAINLVIKEEAKVKMTGQITLGAGLPENFLAEGNTLLFNKKIKFVNVLKANNTGKDLNADLQDFFSALSGSSTVLKTGTTGNPPINNSYYLLNRAASYNFNNLLNTAKGWQIKSNLLGYLDRIDSEFSSSSNYYLEQDTLSYFENQILQRKPGQLNFELSVNKNDDAFYFSNVSKFIFNQSQTVAQMTNQEADFRQKLMHHSRKFSNSLQFTPKLTATSFMNVNWHFNYDESPERLRIEPGINAAIFNQNNPYLGLQQNLNLPKLSNRISLDYRYPLGKISQTLRADWLMEREDFQSDLKILQQNNQFTPFEESFDNRLKWNRDQVQLSSQLQFKNYRIEATAGIPLIFQNIQYADVENNYSNSQKRIVFNPNFSLKYILNSEQFLSSSYSYSNAQGNILNAYRGAVLLNYRTLQANGDDLSIRNSQNLSLNYNFQKSIKMFFMNYGLNYVKANSNTILSSLIDNNISKTVLIPFDNEVNSFSANMGLSKYFFNLGATSGLKLSWNQSQSAQLINGDSYPYTTESISISPSFETRLFNKIGFDYNSALNISTSFIDQPASGSLGPSGSNSNNLSQQYHTLNQNVNLNYNITRFLTARLTGRHQLIKNSFQPTRNYYFIDGFVRYRYVKWRTDFELDLSNLADIKSYRTYSVTANQSFVSQYDLRGRMVVLRTVFNL